MEGGEGRRRGEGSQGVVFVGHGRRVTEGWRLQGSGKECGGRVGGG